MLEDAQYGSKRNGARAETQAEDLIDEIKSDMDAKLRRPRRLRPMVLNAPFRIENKVDSTLTFRRSCRGIDGRSVSQSRRLH
jgi:hypothetical protein